MIEVTKAKEQYQTEMELGKAIIKAKEQKIRTLSARLGKLESSLVQNKKTKETIELKYRQAAKEIVCLTAKIAQMDKDYQRRVV